MEARALEKQVVWSVLEEQDRIVGCSWLSGTALTLLVSSSYSHPMISKRACCWARNSAAAVGVWPLAGVIVAGWGPSCVGVVLIPISPRGGPFGVEATEIAFARRRVAAAIRLQSLSMSDQVFPISSSSSSGEVGENRAPGAQLCFWGMGGR